MARTNLLIKNNHDIASVQRRLLSGRRHNQSGTLFRDGGVRTVDRGGGSDARSIGWRREGGRSRQRQRGVFDRDGGVWAVDCSGGGDALVGAAVRGGQSLRRLLLADCLTWKKKGLPG